MTHVLAGLPAGFPAAIVVVQHLDPLPVKQARENDLIEPGHVYIAPPAHHLLVNSDARLSLTRTQLVHFVRPSADLLFESAAASFKERAIAVVLSGAGVDGPCAAEALLTL